MSWEFTVVTDGNSSITGGVVETGEGGEGRALTARTYIGKCIYSNINISALCHGKSETDYEKRYVMFIKLQQVFFLMEPESLTCEFLAGSWLEQFRHHGSALTYLFYNARNSCETPINLASISSSHNSLFGFGTSLLPGPRKIEDHADKNSPTSH